MIRAGDDGAEPRLLAESAEARGAIEQALDLALAERQSRFVVLRRALPPGDLLSVYADLEARANGGEPALARAYWEQPRSGLSIVSCGRVARIETSGAGRIERSAEQARALFQRLRTCGEDGPATLGPLLLGAFAFSDDHAAVGEWQGMPGGLLDLPRWQRIQRADASCLCVVSEVGMGGDVDALQAELAAAEREALACQAEPWQRDVASAQGEIVAPFASGAEYRVVADRPHAVFRAQVERAVADVRADPELEKVVLARALRVFHPGRFDLVPFLDGLRRQYPTCTTFALAEGARSFLAASPERLVALEGERVETGALAGTAPRGRSPEEDARIGDALLASAKNRAEHAAVVRAIRAWLAEPCPGLHGPVAPRLMKIEGLQHLHTPLSGRLDPSAKGWGVLDLAERLHPTPAVGGLPARPALDWIRRNEGLERGWYAGPVGFVDASGGGEFWVALRSGLVRNAPDEAAGESEARATLFAGVGLVDGSDPEKELQETRLKLRALLAPLTEI